MILPEDFEENDQKVEADTSLMETCPDGCIIKIELCNLNMPVDKLISGTVYVEPLKIYEPILLGDIESWLLFERGLTLKFGNWMMLLL